MPGYFSVERDFLESDFWLSEPFTKPQAWVDLFGVANHSPGYFVKRGIQIPLERSQTGRSELTLAKRWTWSRNKVRRFLKWLEKEKMITLKQDNKTSVITICNYNAYQRIKTEGDTPNDTPKGTAERHQKGTKKNTNNNVENVENKKNVNKKTFSENSNEFRVSLFLFNNIKKNKPDFKEPNLQSWSKDADLLLRRDQRDLEEVKELIQWVQNDDFEQVNVLSMSKLRKRYDQLVLKMNKPQANQMHPTDRFWEDVFNGNDQQEQIEDTYTEGPTIDHE